VVWKLEEHMQEELVIEALRQALATRVIPEEIGVALGPGRAVRQ